MIENDMVINQKLFVAQVVNNITSQNRFYQIGNLSLASGTFPCTNGSVLCCQTLF
jgi:hypothetical protein